MSGLDRYLGDLRNLAMRERRLRERGNAQRSCADSDNAPCRVDFIVHKSPFPKAYHPTVSWAIGRFVEVEAV
jgi:hypothetical protein